MGWGGRWEGGSGWGTHVHPWLSHVNIWQKTQYCKVISLQLKKKRTKYCHYCDMEGPRYYHNGWSKSEKDKYHMTSLKCGI